MDGQINYGKLNFSKNLIIAWSVLLFIGLIQIFLIRDYICYAGDGHLRWDGAHYASWAANLTDILNGNVNHYYIQRILPSIIVHYLMVICGMNFSDTNVITAFEIYNIIILMLTVWIYFAVCTELNFIREQTWIGFASLFLTFPIAKLSFGYPNTTDSSAFLIGIGLLYGYLKDKEWLIIVIGIIGAFVWPMTMYYAAILYIFKKNLIIREDKKNFTGPIIGALLVILYLVYIIWSGLGKQVIINNAYIDLGEKTVPVDNKLFILSTLCTCIYLYLLYHEIFKNISLLNFKIFINRFVLLRVFIVMLVSCGIIYFQNLISLPDNVSFFEVIKITVLGSILRPFIFLVSAISWLGPVIIFAVYYFKNFANGIRNLGPGFFIVSCLSLLLLLVSETRLLSEYLPFLIIGIVFTIQPKKLSVVPLPLFIFVCLLFSKIWLPVKNHNSLYFMNFGPWMQPKWYLIQLAIYLLCFIVLFFFSRKKKQIPFN